MDWGAFSKGFYVKIALRVKMIAKYTAEAISKLVSAGLHSNSLHIIGFSLGAQIAGFVGRHLDFAIPRISGKNNFF